MMFDFKMYSQLKPYVNLHSQNDGLIKINTPQSCMDKSSNSLQNRDKQSLLMAIIVRNYNKPFKSRTLINAEPYSVNVCLFAFGQKRKVAKHRLLLKSLAKFTFGKNKYLNIDVKLIDP